MKIFVVVVTLWQLAHGTPQSDAFLESLLAKEEKELSPDMLNYRKDIFEASWLAKEEDDELSLEAMYTLSELEKKRGGVYLPSFNESLQLLKRGSDDWMTRSTPAVYDPRRLTIVDGNGEKIPMMNKAVSQETCGNCYLHTFVAALEIAYVKATGTKTKFSEQEMTDCYFKGCDGGDYRMVTILMSYIDKLSSKGSYGSYLDGKFTCRQATTPDNLDKIKITGSVTVTPGSVQAAIISFGSVMTCMKWGIKEGDACRMDNYKTGSIVDYPSFDGLSEGRCDHAILIVGYTPAFYIVRNSYGVSWGDEGYFYIRRGTNSCGIEVHMASLSVEARQKKDKKELRKNGCPKNKPKYCKSVNSCISSNENCVATSQKLLKKRSLATDDNKAADINIQKRCANQHPKCKKLIKTVGCSHEIPKKYCKKSCKICSAEEIEVPIKDDDQETRGDCYKPTILNGVVKNSPIMRTGEEMIVECNAGYTLTGKAVKCLIQNVFTNEDKDGRLMPECLKLGQDVLVGNGAKYTGSKNTYTDADKGELVCDSWNKDVLEGFLVGNMEGYKYILGNHNYCRNPSGTDPVPKCLSINDDGLAFPVFCFQHPGCNACVGVSENLYPAEYCQAGMEQGKCAYGAANSAERQNFYWENCQETCCKAFCPQ